MRRALRSAAEEDHRAIIEADYRLAEERRRLREDEKLREHAAKDAGVDVLIEFEKPKVPTPRPSPR